MPLVLHGFGEPMVPEIGVGSKRGCYFWIDTPANKGSCVLKELGTEVEISSNKVKSSLDSEVWGAVDEE